jgi:hypothetical protein
MQTAAPAAPRYAPAMRIKGGPMTTGWQKSYTEVPEGVEDAYSDARIDSALADQADQDAARRRADDIEVASRLANRRRQELEAQAEKQRQDQLEAQRRAQRDLALTQERIAEMEVDPERWMSDKSTIAQIGLAIASAMGTLGSSMTGREDPVQRMIENRIAADIDAQKAKIAQANTGLQAKKGLYADMLQIHGNETAATLASQAALESMIARGLEQRAKRISDPEWRADAMRRSAAMTEQSAQTMERLGAVKVSENIANVPDRVVGGGPIKSPDADPLADLTKEERKEFDEISKEAADVAAGLDAIQKARESVASTDGAGLGIVGRRLPDDLAGNPARTVRSRVGNAGLLTAKALGLSRAEIQEFSANMVSSWTPEDIAGGLDDAEAQLRAKLNQVERTKSERARAAHRRLMPEIYRAPSVGKAPGQ